MKINIAFISPNEGIGGGNRKYSIYFKYLTDELFNKYYITLTDKKIANGIKSNEKTMSESELPDFIKKNNIQFLYLGNSLSSGIYTELKKHTYILRNINFTPLYTTEEKNLNLIISKTDYLKLKYIHKNLKNSYVVYNPIDVGLWRRLKKSTPATYREFFKNKKTKLILGRLARAEPSKWNFLIIKTLLTLQREKNYKYGFVFAGMPKLYIWTLKMCLDKKMKRNILFVPEQKEHESIAKFYSSIDLFWQTSLIGESFGNVIAESFCFEVPVITDYKDFFEDINNDKFKVNKKLYNAQTEVVDHGKNGVICNYPGKIIDFLENTDHKELRRLGLNGLKKVESQYDAKIAGNTLAKILYYQLLKDGKIKKESKFENLQMIPTKKEILDFDKEYRQRVKEEIAANRLPKKEEIRYRRQEKCWQKIEFVYLVIRKLLKKIKIDLEKM